MALTRSDLHWLSLTEVRDLMQRREVSPVEVTEATLARIQALDPSVNSYITVLGDQARAEAREAERRIAAGQAGALTGVPIALKDIVDLAGVRTTAASAILQDNVAAEDATIVERLRAAGAVIVGKLTLHEFAFGGTNDNPHFGACRNPWGLDRIPGGSSGGSGAAVAAGFCYGAIGTDTGGSIRLPAHYCGVVGLMASYARVPTRGVFPLAWSLDHAGPLTRTVRDAAVMLQAIAGHDPRDPLSADVPLPDFAGGIDAGLRGLRIGMPRSYFFEDLDAAVARAVEAALDVLRDLGAELIEVEFPYQDQIGPIGWTIVMAEGAAVHQEHLREKADLFGPDVRVLVELGALRSAVDYIQAQRGRSLLRAEAEALFDRVDALVTPAAPVTATPIGARSVLLNEQRRDLALLQAKCSLPFDLTGQPAMSIPCGFDDAGLPIGVQIAGRCWDEATVLRVAHAYEQATEWHKRHPPIA
ncbi:MAG TPA: amidase [Dehalococcoidia bacterium]|nr:amidase [Dehalococcoidia bacterium]